MQSQYREQPRPYSFEDPSPYPTGHASHHNSDYTLSTPAYPHYDSYYVASANVAALSEGSITKHTSTSVLAVSESVPVDTVTNVQDHLWDQLNEVLDCLRTSDWPPSLEEAGRRLLYLVVSSTASKEPYRRLLQYCDDQAQLLIDGLQWLLEYFPLFEGSQRRIVVQALVRLAKRTKLLPKAYTLDGVVAIGEVIYQTPNVDIFRGTYRGKSVCLKKYRIAAQWSRCELEEDIWDRKIKMMIEEIILWSNLRHPNIIPFEGFYQPDSNIGSTYLVSPFVEHGTISQYLKTHPEACRALLFSDVVEGLSYLHRNALIHGDIKGCNVLVDSSGRACLADLGLSRVTDEDIVTWTSIRTATPAGGTLYWIAPELLEAQFRGIVMKATAASDIYSLGCLAYEIFTGRIPFEELTSHCCSNLYAQQIILKQVVKRGRLPEKPSLDHAAYARFGLTESIWMMMETCWDRDPNLRPSISDISTTFFLLDLVDDRPKE